MKFKTYILTIKYNIKEDKPEFIKEEIIGEDDEVLEFEEIDIDDLTAEDMKDLQNIGFT